MGDIAQALQTVLNPQAPDDAQRHANAQLQAFKASTAGLQWAVQALDGAAGAVAAGAGPAGGPDEAQLWLASDTVLHWCKFRPTAADGQGQLRRRLWALLRGGGLPHFAQAKLAAALAGLACLCWPPEFWGDLHACLAEQPAVGLRVLAALLEEFQATTAATSSGLRGRVLSSQVPTLQARYSEVQPAALALLASLLRHSQSALAATAAQQAQQLGGELALAREALRTLCKAISDPPARPAAQQGQQQAASATTLLELLFGFSQALDLAAPDSPASCACQEVSAAAMDCIGEILLKPTPPQQAAQLREALVAQLLGCLACLQRAWERGGMQADGGEEPALAACVRLFSQFLTTQLGRVERVPELQQRALGLLRQVAAMSFARRSPADVLAFGEVWHALLDYRDSLELEASWGEEEDEGDTGAAAGAGVGPNPPGDPYKGVILEVAVTVLGTLFSAGPAPGGPQPPFHLAQLDGSEGSGAALEDWMQAVSSAGEGEGEEEAAAAEMGDDADEGEVLVPGSRQYAAASQTPSEQEVYARQAEALLSRVAATYSSAMLPLVLGRFYQCSVAFAGACQRLGAALQQAQQAQQGELESAGAAAVAASRDLEVALRLLARCGVCLPQRGVEEQASLAELAGAPAAVGTAAEPAVVTGGHAVATYSLLLDLASGWQQTVQAVAAGDPVVSTALLPALAPVGARIFRTLGALTATWLARLMLSGLGSAAAAAASGPADGGGEQGTVLARLAHGMLAAPAALLGALGPGACQVAAAGRALLAPAEAAAEALVPLTSIALSSSMRPPAALLDGLLVSPSYQTLQQLGTECLSSPALPTRAVRALWLALSDLSLRSWGSTPAAEFPTARAAHFAAVAAPLAACFTAAGAAAAQGGQGGHASGGDAVVRRAVAVAQGVVLSYAGTPKHVRGIMFSSLVAALLPSTLSLLRLANPPPGVPPMLGGRAGAALLRLLGSVLEVAALELGQQGLEQLLGALVETYSAGGGDPTLESDLALEQLLCSVMSQGGGRHQALLAPALQFCLGVWQRAGQAASRDADMGHIRAVTLGCLLSLLRNRWRQLSGAHVQQSLAAASAAARGAPAPGGSGGGPLSQLHQQLAAAAVGSSGAAAGAGAMAAGVGPAAIAQTLALLQEYIAAAAAGHPVLAAADVRLVLEELYELQVVARLYQSPQFLPPLREALLGGLLSLLLSRCYTAAQNDIVDTLFSIAAANWSDFHLSFLPRFAEQRLGGLGAGERAALLELLGVQDLDGPTFERQVLAFMNDVLHHEQAGPAA